MYRFIISSSRELENLKKGTLPRYTLFSIYSFLLFMFFPRTTGLSFRAFYCQQFESLSILTQKGIIKRFFFFLVCFLNSCSVFDLNSGDCRTVISHTRPFSSSFFVLGRCSRYFDDRSELRAHDSSKNQDRNEDAIFKIRAIASYVYTRANQVPHFSLFFSVILLPLTQTKFFRATCYVISFRATQFA